ncbi:MAG: hypothetical protein KY455_09280 [Euryarchaeota archaeon]|nr:hypothetical protein [Euryarchaeota archaeon]
MAKEMGDIVRWEPASQPKWAAGIIFVLMIVVLVNSVLFVTGLALGWNDPVHGYSDNPVSQEDLMLWLSNAFLGVALIISLYRRFFTEDILVVKKRHPKYEDFLEKYDIE